MDYIPRELANQFATAFAGERRGFSGRQITDYFGGYSNLVKPYDHYGFTPKRSDLFIEALYSLQPKQQYYAINDLLWFERESKYDYPTEALRIELREKLHSFISTEPIGLAFSKIESAAIREDWMEAYGRILSDPPGAITAGRTLLETTLKTIINDRGHDPDKSGKLMRLVKQAEDVLGFSRAEQQAEHEVLGGLASVSNGIATLANEAGDRHGTIMGIEINDKSVVQLCVNACGVLAMTFLDMHLLSPMKGDEAPSSQLIVPDEEAQSKEGTA